VTLLGDVAEDFDSQLREAERALDDWVESRHYSTSSMVGASFTGAPRRSERSIQTQTFRPCPSIF
jgi:hypothetical protein